MHASLHLASSGRPTLRERYRDAPTFEAMRGAVAKNVELWTAMWRHARVDDEYVRRVASLPGRWYLLVLSEDWCGDAVNTVPIVARLAERCPNVDLRVLARDANLDLMDAHLTGSSRSIPVIIVLDEAFEERGWWGPRPTVLQRWVSGQGQLLEKTARYREARTWYARDRGRTTLEEVVSMLERAAAAGTAATS
jgi:arginase family enzyme